MHQHVRLLARNPGMAASDSTASATFSSKPLVTTTSGSMSTCQPVSLEVSRAFWPRLPMASESWSSLTMILTRLRASSISKALSLAGARALVMKFSDVRVPADDVHLLVVQFADDVLHPLPAQTDAGAHRIHLLVARPDRQLGAETRLARDALDFNGAVVDLGHFELEQLDDEPRDRRGTG